MQASFDNSLLTATVKQLMQGDSFSEPLIIEQFVIREMFSMSYNYSKYTGPDDISGNIHK